MATLVSEITILSCTLMTMIVSLISQVFQDGSTYRGRLKLLCRVVVKACYEDMLQPNIVEGHNSDQAIMTIRDNVTKILQDSTFLLATEPDENVSLNSNIILISCDKCFFFLSTRAAPRTLPTNRLLNLLTNFITLESLTASRFYFRMYLADLFRSIVLQ